MALQIGDIGATTGMAGAIYDQLLANIEPGLGELSEEELEPIRDGWRRLAHAVATGVIQHLVANLEIHGVQTRGDVAVALSGATAPANAHQHGAGTLRGSQSGVTFTQVAGTGTIS